jgi:hypothetical protein
MTIWRMMMNDSATSTAERLREAVLAVTKIWSKQRKAEERDDSARLRRHERPIRSQRVTAKAAAWEMMEQAYMAASTNGTLPANARQIMYAARPFIQQRTGKTLDDVYFTQTLLPDYLAEHEVDWDVAYDDRGHLIEPHTGRMIGLGTLNVRNYLEQTHPLQFQPPKLAVGRIVTHGPHGCYGALFYIEKEGFVPLFEAVLLGERYDIAIMSNKGMSVTAARMLVEQLARLRKIPLVVLHDFDKAGFSIFGTWKRNTRRYRWEHRVKVIDLGLRLADIRDLCRRHGLNIDDLTESVPDKDESREARRANLLLNGATAEEAEFLLTRRVELNAFSSEQLVDFIERKLKQHKVRKVIPGKDTLAKAYRMFALNPVAERIMARELAKLANAPPVRAPRNLLARAQEYLQQNPHKRWDEAVQEVAETEMSTHNSNGRLTP